MQGASDTFPPSASPMPHRTGLYAVLAKDGSSQCHLGTICQAMRSSGGAATRGRPFRSLAPVAAATFTRLPERCVDRGR